jgi:DNA ligase-1
MKQTLANIFQTIDSTNSVSQKEEILRKHKDNEQLKKLLEFALNPYKLFQFNKMPCVFEKEAELEHTQEWKFSFLEGLLNDLAGRYTTGNDAKAAVTAVFKLFDEPHFNLYSKVLTKEAIGVGASTVNKVWPGLIPEFKLMLAPNELPIITNVKYPCYIQPKLDGYRCIYKNGAMYSRKGKPFGNENLAKYFNKLFEVEDSVLDGELYCEGVNFNKLQTILNTYDTPLPNTLKFVIYDCVPVKDWEAQSCKKPYSERIRNVREVVNAIADYKKVIDIANDEVEDSKEAITLYKEYLKKKYEGAMIKAIDGMYRWKRVTLRSGEMLKLKPFKTEDLEIVDVFEGEGKFSGTLGGIIVSGPHITTTSVGSGFSDAIREEVWKNKSKYIGKTAEIQYFEITEDKSLRFPVFKRFRDDK